MLEKGMNKATKSYIFDTLAEARQMQQYGGTIAVVSKTKFVEIIKEEMQCNPLDIGLDLDYDTPQVQYKEIWDTTAKSFYVLNISDEKTLANGFIY